ncbi:G patch domain-containing protein 4 [Aplysia californica]|uniref:G patch domain-containing protein 4 n=1 Tax=Aplysia californica TaxID=6500 RepID=A0ABM1A6M5_APLCA|nr:G patch domain-containing protein 4 [Aplysia californica]
MAASEFARKQLEKHGWKKGSGLGKEEHGRADPIKVTLKMDKAGVGHDPGKEFTDHWWMRAFNDAAKKIGTKKQADPSESAETKKEKETSDRKKRFYAQFVKSSVLANGVEEKDEDAESSSEDEDSTPQESLPTLDDLHKFCGGATGHRAAMFGFKMKGKLGRVAAHDRMFEEKLKSDSQSLVVGSIDTKLDETERDSPSTDKKKKRKKSKNRVSSDAEVGSSKVNDENVDIADDVSNVKTKKKRRKRDQEESSSNEAAVKGKENRNSCDDAPRPDVEKKETCLSAETIVCADESGSKTKRKKKSKSVAEDLPVTNVEQTDDSQMKEKTKKKKRKNETIEIDDESAPAKSEVGDRLNSSQDGNSLEGAGKRTTDDCPLSLEQPSEDQMKIKKKKKKRKHETAEVDDESTLDKGEVEGSVNSSSNSSKVSKKKKKKKEKE